MGWGPGGQPVRQLSEYRQQDMHSDRNDRARGPQWRRQFILTPPERKGLKAQCMGMELGEIRKTNRSPEDLKTAELQAPARARIRHL